MKTFKTFQQEAYSQPERKSHTPVIKLPVDRKLKIHYGPYKPPKTQVV